MKYAVTNNDGSVTILTTVNGADPQVEISKWDDASKSKVTSIAPIADTDIPADRCFRNGWALSGGKIVHDMSKCRDIHREQMRVARVPKLAALDVAFMRAVETGDAAEQVRIAAEKQTLRDVTADPAIEAAQTVDVLKGVWPERLCAS